jgi:catechol 2,3-dioxygenase-like lactoylglutathione lyase family enzyme
MKIACLDHVNVRTPNVEPMSAWYEAVLGLARGPRPDFPFPGAWLYLGDRAIVHLVGTQAAPGADPADLRLEHFALEAEGLPAFLDRLAATGTAYRLGVTPGEPPVGGIVQVNIADPDGNHIHVDFREPLPPGVTV